MRLLLLLLVCWVLFTNGFDFKFPNWNGVLQDYVMINQQLPTTNIQLNVLNYTAVRMDERFGEFLGELEVASGVEDMNQTYFYSFFINAYNALAVNLILTYPCGKDLFGYCGGTIKSIRNIGSSNAVWNLKAGVVAGKNYSLQQIEDLLRKPPKPLKEEPRIHGAIVCCSISCPNLRPEAYVPTRIDEQLQDNMENFLSIATKGSFLDEQGKTLTLSAIFDWFKQDFENFVNGSVVDYLIKQDLLTKSQVDFLKSNKVQVKYFNYNWNLNGYFVDAACNSRHCFHTVSFVITILAVVVFVAFVVLLILFMLRRHRKQYSRL